MTLDPESVELWRLRRSGSPDIGPAPLRSTERGAGSFTHGQAIRMPEEEFAPAGALVVDTIADITLGAAQVGNILELDVPGANRLRISGIGWSADDPAALANMLWSLFAGEAIVGGITQMPAGVGSIEQPMPVRIHIPGEVHVRFQVNNNQGLVAFTYQLHVVGWMYQLTG